MRFALASLLATYVAAEDSFDCKIWKDFISENFYACDFDTWICTCDGHPIGTNSPCEDFTEEIQEIIAAKSSAGGS